MAKSCIKSYSVNPAYNMKIPGRSTKTFGEMACRSLGPWLSTGMTKYYFLGTKSTLLLTKERF